MPLNYTVEIYQENGTITYKQITVKSFVTNSNLVKWHNGVVGMSPCPAGLEEYNFGYQLMGEQITNVQYQQMDSNPGEELSIGALLRINEPDWPYS